MGRFREVNEAARGEQHRVVSESGPTMDRAGRLVGRDAADLGRVMELTRGLRELAAAGVLDREALRSLDQWVRSGARGSTGNAMWDSLLAVQPDVFRVLTPPRTNPVRGSGNAGSGFGLNWRDYDTSDESTWGDPSSPGGPRRVTGAEEGFGLGPWDLVAQDPAPPPPPPPGPPPRNEDGTQAPLSAAELEAHRARVAYVEERRRAAEGYEREHEGDAEERAESDRRNRAIDDFIRWVDRHARPFVPPEIRRHLPPAPPPLPDPGPDGATAGDIAMARLLLSRTRSPATNWPLHRRSPMDYARPGPDSADRTAPYAVVQRVPLADEPEFGGSRPVAGLPPWVGGDPRRP